MSDARDPRVVEAYDLLRRVVEDDGAPQPAPSTPWHITQVEMPLDSEEVSGTDMLALWLPNMAAGTAEGSWDSYFGKSAPPASEPTPEAPPANPELHLLTSTTPTTEALTDRAAAGAVDALYAFVHALGRLDLEAAMACISADYHCLFEDREQDADDLRRYLEGLFDGLRGATTVESYLSEVPEPIPHPLGVLIHCTLVIDTVAPDGRRGSLSLERVALLNETPPDGWHIDSLAEVGRPG